MTTRNTQHLYTALHFQVPAGVRGLRGPCPACSYSLSSSKQSVMMISRWRKEEPNAASTMTMCHQAGEVLPKRVSDT